MHNMTSVRAHDGCKVEFKLCIGGPLRAAARRRRSQYPNAQEVSRDWRDDAVRHGLGRRRVFALVQRDRGSRESLAATRLHGHCAARAPWSWRDFAESLGVSREPVCRATLALRTMLSASRWARAQDGIKTWSERARLAWQRRTAKSTLCSADDSIAVV